MNARLISHDATGIKVEVTIPYAQSMLRAEEQILSSLNEAGNVATQHMLGRFDTDGSPIEVCGHKLTSKGRLPKAYQTPYGDVTVNRHVYQSNLGGKTFVPLEKDARIVVTSTPRFAKMISHKYAELGSSRIVDDLGMNHGRKVVRSFVQRIAEAVGAIAQLKEECWTYSIPKMDKPVAAVSVGLDGVSMFYKDDGWREAMVGTISLYDKQGERQHTVYIGASPEYGKETFLSRLERELAHVKEEYPRSTYIGLADGAKCNWEFLEQHTDKQLIDFYHASEYLTQVADAALSSDERSDWLESRCSELKHNHGAATRQVREMEELKARRMGADDRASIEGSISYFRNNKQRMNYAEFTERNMPIGSGVTEAACKVIVKQRLCCSGMKWKDRGASVVMSLRCLSHTNGRWNQFWDKVDQYGTYSEAA